MRIIGTILLLLVILQGCGRKGALFMPTHQPDAQATPDQPEQSEQP